MGVRRGHRIVVVSGVLCMVAWLVGCATPKSFQLKYQPGFSSLPSTCAAAVRPAESAVQAYADELYDAGADFEHTDGNDSDQFSDLNCVMKYSDPILRQPVAPHRVAMSRSFAISMSLDRSPRSVGTTTSRLAAQATTTGNNARPQPLPGIGEDAIVWVEEFERRVTRVGVRFRIGNLQVEVETFGRDWSGVPQTFPVANSPELREDLRAGAQSIAEAIAQQARSAYPTTVYDYESPTRVTSRTRTTTSTTVTPSAEKIWDSCAVPESDLAAADIRIQQKSSGCSWRGEWFQILAPGVAANYESTLFELGHQTYARPTPLTIGDRSAVMLHWETTDSFCVLAFDVLADPQAPREPRVIIFEASKDKGHTRDALCTELVRVATVIVGLLPPAARAFPR
ncbi:hypothetical protein [Nocardia noduli]|uniref:hypothetical protein n=1 Tax=Nocardia noduli TaxID=2815722 RepID=UPI001C212BDB|nr:hypothetical protein [Nocardia noduli]